VYTFREKLRLAQNSNASWVCVGLDPVLDRLPASLGKSDKPLLEFCNTIVDNTHDVVSAYKPNLAFWLAQGSSGVDQLQRLIEHIPDDIPVILDGKFGDVGHTAELYALAAYGQLGADAVTANPYLGVDAISPFVAVAQHGVFLLARTSNPSAPDMQNLALGDMQIYKYAAKLAAGWDLEYSGTCGVVVGATYPGELAQIRSIAPDLPFLIPGIGAQGGDLRAAVEHGSTADGIGPIINSSRGIIYASSGSDFAAAAREAALTLRDRINECREEAG